MIEAQTLEGISGSPVFLHEIVDLGFTELLKKPDIYPKAFGLVKLLGVYIGSWEGSPGEILAKDRGLGEGVRVPVGIGIVVMADKLEGLINNNVRLRQLRTEFAEAEKIKRAASMDSSIPFSDSEPPTKGDTPTHKEDFNRLLDAAVRKPEQDDPNIASGDLRMLYRYENSETYFQRCLLDTCTCVPRMLFLRRDQ